MTKMIGCMVAGALIALGVSKVMRARRWGGCGYRGFHGYRHHDHGGWERGRWGGGPWWLGTVLDRLQVTPAQERAVYGAADELRAEMRKLRDEAEPTRRELAAALRKPVFDEVLLGELFARHDGVIERARKAFVGFAARVHDALDERQRAELADMIERGPRFFRGW
jgi:Spy/CpxP family protein refolding chaperone